MIEVWKTIRGTKGYYQVSNFGRFKVSDKESNHWQGGKKIRKGKIIKGSNREGYLQIRLNVPGIKTKTIATHRIVAKYFIPNPKKRNEINHINGIKDDNRPENLEWCTHSENALHSFRIGLQCNKGDNHPHPKLNSKQVLEIRSKYKTGKYSMSQLGKEYGVVKTTISAIIRKVNWSHI